MDLEQIRLLIEVEQHGSIQAVARRLGVSRSTVRRSLLALEEEIGEGLMVSGPLGASLTRAGQVVVERGRRLLEDSAALLSEARASARQAGGVLRLIVPTGAPIVARVMAFSALRIANPGLSLDVIERDEPLKHLDETFDAMIYMGEPPETGEWFSRLLQRLEAVPLAHPSYLARHGRPTQPEELADHVLLSWRTPVFAPGAWPLRGGGVLPVAPVLTTSDMNVIQDCVVRGLGIGMFPCLPLGNEELVPVLDDEVGVEIPVRMLLPRPSSSDPSLRAFLDNIVQIVHFRATEPGTAPERVV